MAHGALHGIRVIELGQMISAPFCARLFADYGADVVKIEPPKGELARQMGPYPDHKPDPEKSGLYFTLNTNKRAITLDHTQKSGQELLLKLIADADVLIENYQPAEMKQWGLDYATLETINPKLVMISITPFGQTGPYASWKGYDLNAFHLAGIGSCYVGDPDREPLKPGTYLADYFGGTTGATYGMAAVFGRDVVGSGQQVDVSCADVLFATITGAIDFGRYELTGEERSRTGKGSNISSPSGIFPCKDGHVWMFAADPAHWAGLVNCMGNPEWAVDPAWADPMVRGEQHSEEIEKGLTKWMADKGKMELMDLFQSNNVASTAIMTPTELVSHPHLPARGFFHNISHPELGEITDIGAPFQMKESPPTPPHAAPTLGQHNEEIFCGRLGLDAETMSNLRAQGVI